MFGTYRLPPPPQLEAARDRFTPRALLHRSPSELYRLIRSLEAEAVAAAEIGLDDYGDYLFRRVAELREAGR